MRDKIKRFAPFLLIIFGAAITYLPLINKFGYYNDDWYLMYLARVSDSNIFHTIFSIDRPLRAYVMISAFTLFGSDPLPYNIIAFIFRLLGGLCFYWLLTILWPKQRVPSAVMALLFTIYPGFLSQPNAIDYQSYIFGSFLVFLSIALTVKALITNNITIKILLMISSILAGWIYLGIIEYFAGLEVLRILSIFVLTSRENKSLKNTLQSAIWKWSPFAVIPLGFLIWQMFFFNVQRKATDLTAQLGTFISSPIFTGLRWLTSLIQDSIKALFLAWGVPFYQFLFELRLRDLLLSFGISIIGILLLYIILHSMNETKDDEAQEWRVEGLWLGLSSAILSLVPIMLSNRNIEFQNYSRYSLPAAAGSAIFAVTIIYYLPLKNLRLFFIGLLTFLSIFTHYANGTRYVENINNMREFWWQISWRAPQIASKTTLVADYAIAPIQEDYFVWGPANLIYYSQKHKDIPVNLELSALVLTIENTQQILLARGGQEDIGRGNISTRDFENILILSQPSEISCVHVIDGKLPELSIYNQERILLIAPYSDIQNIQIDASPRTPPELIFGQEPDHGWCYYYQKAELARQKQDWQTIIKLSEQVFQQDLRPDDLIEWMPFLQSYAMTNDLKNMKMVGTIIGDHAFLRRQTCRMLMDIKSKLSPEAQQIMDNSFCFGKILN